VTAADQDVFIVSALRTPVGSLLGALKRVDAASLEAIVLREAGGRADLSPADVDGVFIGVAVGAGLGPHPARRAAAEAGLPCAPSAVTIGSGCGSGLLAVRSAIHSIRAGDARIVAAGGAGSASRCPHLVLGLREGLRLGHGEAVDSVLHDGPCCSCESPGGRGQAEKVARTSGLSRARLDRYALESHRRASAAIGAGSLEQETAPVEVVGKRNAKALFRTDESPRGDMILEQLAMLPPLDGPEGRVTAGNSAALGDGAAAVILASVPVSKERSLQSLGRIVGCVVAESSGDDEPPQAAAIRRLLDATGWSLSSVDLVEIDEASAVQPVACIERLGLDAQHVNADGGDIALGRLLGGGGARHLVTLVHALRRHGLSRGLVTVCLGEGAAIAIAVDRPGEP